jgi:hypothetical protein
MRLRLMPKKVECISVIAIDQKDLFIGILNNLRKFTLSVNLWGKIQKKHLENFSKFIVTRGLISYIRKYIFNEYRFDIQPEQNEEFLVQSLILDFEHLNWGIFIENEIIGFSRAIDDIIFYPNSYLPLENMLNLLINFQNKRIVKKFELIE